MRNRREYDEGVGGHGVPEPESRSLGHGSVFSVGDRLVGTGHPCLVVAEVGQNHDGSLGTAHAFIDAIADTGADAVKFQTHIAAAETTPSEPFRVHFSRQDATRYDYWKRMEFREHEWVGLADHARERGLIFMSSPFSEEAVNLLLRCGIKVWKVASGELTNTPLLSQLAGTGLPIIVSTGMTTLSELRSTMDILRSSDVPTAVLQCTSYYPTQPEQIGIMLMQQYREWFNCPVGLSDHSGTIFSGLAAATLSANIIEVHVTLSRYMFGPDIVVSLTPAELSRLVHGVRFIERMMTATTSKDQLAEQLAPMRQIFFKSVVARRSMAAGTILTKADVAVKKPGTGIPAEQLEDVLGRRLLVDVREDTVLQYEQFAP